MLRVSFDTDQERGWSTPEWEQYLEDKGIQQRYKVDKFAPNSLGMVDNAIARIKRYIRRRLTEEDLDADSWDQFLDEAVTQANSRKQEVLYRQSADDLYQNDGEPMNEYADHTIFALEQEQAEKLAKNRARHQRQNAAADPGCVSHPRNHWVCAPQCFASLSQRRGAPSSGF